MWTNSKLYVFRFLIHNIDEISNLKCVSSDEFSCTTNSYPFSDQNIAWPADSERFGPTKWTSEPNWETKIVPPPLWQKAFPKWANGYNSTNLPNLKEFTRLQVWMRTAGLPTFRKLWGINENSVLPKGTWEIDITQSNLA